MEITERILNDAGGWQVMKQAKSLHEMGRVSDATWQEPLLQGRVREGESEYRSGLKIISKSNIENLCSCRLSRQRGQICAHSVAVGLQYLRPLANTAAQPVVAPTATKSTTPTSSIELKPIFSTSTGERAELSVILPPNLVQQWPRGGGVTIGVESVAGGKRTLISALPQSGTYQVSEGDLRLISALRQMADGQLPGTAMLPRERFLELLAALIGHDRVRFGRDENAAVDGLAYKPTLFFESTASGALRLKTQVEAGVLLMRAGAQCWILRDRRFQPVAAGLPIAYLDVTEREITIPAEHVEAFLARELPLLEPHFEMSNVPAVAATPALAIVALAPKFILNLEGSLNHLVAKLEAKYGEQRVTLTGAPGRSQIRRDLAAESRAVGRLNQAGFSAPDGQGEMLLKGEPKILSFFARELPDWQKDAEVHIGTRFEHVTKDIERVQPKLEIRSSGENWFDLQIELATGSGERFSASEIQRLLQAGQTSVRRKNGTLAVFNPEMLEEFQQVLQDCDPEQKQPGLYKIDRRHAAYIDSVAAEQGNSVQAPAEWRSWSSGTRELEKLKPVPLGSLDSTLRDYQKQGVYWMHYLAKNRLAGILADEMGLGKTVQTLALLRSLGGTALIVCPSSLVYNWEREAAKFTPDRRVLAITGADRQGLFGKPLAEADLVITSYALLRRDIESYRKLEFTATVLDEAHHIKNPDTQNAQAALTVRSKHRFALTGTPIENSLRDLWSLMQFLMPGYLGKLQDFRERYERPITADPGGPEQQRLIKRLRPFVLRRTKAKVAKELPDKIIQVAYCELSESQKHVYSDLLSAARRQASELAGSKDQGKRRIAMLTAILRLRQACCDLRLLGDIADKEKDPSAKLDLLNELVGEALDGGHRVLIFSQFVSMLKIAREALTETGIETCYLDGSTKDRAKEVDRFQNGEAPVFLISLKAGGTGLNLTAADTVVHFDPWWNPAVEDQATDRAHRIGQEKVVTAYKLITRGTIEEKILALQTKKRKLSDLAVESEQPLMQGLDTEELEDLLR